MDGNPKYDRKQSEKKMSCFCSSKMCLNDINHDKILRNLISTSKKPDFRHFFFFALNINASG